MLVLLIERPSGQQHLSISECICPKAFLFSNRDIFLSVILEYPKGVKKKYITCFIYNTYYIQMFSILYVLFQDTSRVLEHFARFYSVIVFCLSSFIRNTSPNLFSLCLSYSMIGSTLICSLIILFLVLSFTLLLNI